uniref:ODAD1 central coiled coil region domain-containing protein n=1 Tax=Neobodo designis TaxID=312471 RepID=A0A7S1Q6Z5_NEODS|mmetsp:Transcript_33672/g.103930  ORF Transcript_33672/g.103930 Transcript_33672/m.103930 type:complete len:536 (+) Transcript_33672:95-1702(+)|eukprot:CAMPEP_0174839222 /NCGR_PEP_ID=MMETSP1114-20130205/7899_1 /TAXON_ID=312471 /ORGANISM="Neobodo designis, Strain CCAP 1951/1" /LENGTH=535 /DNA_ID=CAMNT_0016073343 /DNA_START=95 /DNA_END=1702 /DNA_ORIENTATION=+
MALTSSNAAGVSAADTTSDPNLLHEKMRLLEQDRKAYFETTSSQLQNNKEAIRQLRHENKELKTIIAAAKKGTGSLQATEAAHLDREIFALTLKLDEARDKESERKELLAKEEEKLAEVDQQCKPVLTPESSLTHKIRMLENRLDKSLIKYNEALSIQKTYEEIVKRLREERVGFDNQLAAIERTLKAKEFDYQELLKMSHAANHAKEVAKRELQKFKLAFDEERKAKDRELAERKAYVQAKVDQTQKLERKEAERRQKEKDEAEAQRQRQLEEAEGRRPGQHALAGGPRTAAGEDDARLGEYEAAFRRIKEATGVRDVAEMLQRFVSQEQTHKNLEAMSSEAESRIAQLKSENAELASRLEDLRYGGSGQLGSRRIVEEFEVHLAEAANQTRKHGERYEHLAKLLIDVKAGIEHLAEKLSGVRSDLKYEPMSDENAASVLNVCLQKLTVIVEEVPPADVGADDPATALVPVDIPFNRRVRLPREESDDEDDDAAGQNDQDDDVVLKRDQVKKLSANSIQRESKKKRRRMKGDRM